MPGVFKNTYTKNGVKKSVSYFYTRVKNPRTERWLNFSTGVRERRLALRVATNIQKLVDKVMVTGVTPEVLADLQFLPHSVVKRLIRHGLLPAEVSASSHSVMDHLEEFSEYLAGRGTCEHRKHTVARLKKIIQGCGFRFAQDIKANVVEEFLAKLRQEENLALETLNHYITAIKNFCNWLVRKGILTKNPVHALRKWNAETDRRRKRRVLSEQEICRLLEGTRAGPVRYGLSGEERFLLYVIALSTGLRANEIRSLRVKDVLLEGPNAAIQLSASVDKAKKERVQPIPESIVPLLKKLTAGKSHDQLLIRVPKWHLSTMLKRDLESVGIPYETSEGVFDFHAFRHQFATWVVAAAPSMKVAQELVRHSDPKLTYNRYAKVRQDDLRQVLCRLPTLLVLEAVIGDHDGARHHQPEAPARKYGFDPHTQTHCEQLPSSIFAEHCSSSSRVSEFNAQARNEHTDPVLIKLIEQDKQRED